MKSIMQVGTTNYQGYIEATIDLEPGFNAIIGPSDCGKTSIKRAIETVLYNKYVSDEYIREGARSFENYVLFDDGTRIVRSKGKGLNRYVIYYPDGETLELNNFGTGVPQEVMDAHGMHLVPIGKKLTSLNSSDQLDGPFLLKNTPGERATIIGSIAKTQAIDEAVSNTLSSLREKSKQLKTMTTANKTLEKDIKNLEYVKEARVLMDNMEKDLLSLTASINKFDLIQSKFGSIEESEITAAAQRAIMNSLEDFDVQERLLEYLLKDFTLYNSAYFKYNGLLRDIERYESLNKDNESLQGIESVHEQIIQLSDTMSEYSKIEKQVTLLNSDLKNREQLSKTINNIGNLDGVAETIDKIMNDLRGYHILDAKCSELGQLEVRYNNGVQVIKELGNLLDTKVSEYQDALKTLGKCPTCFSDISPTQFEAIRENLI